MNDVSSFGVCVTSGERAAEIVSRLVAKRVPLSFDVVAAGSLQITVAGEHASALLDAIDESAPNRCAVCGDIWAPGGLNSHRECSDCARNRQLLEWEE